MYYSPADVILRQRLINTINTSVLSGAAAEFRYVPAVPVGVGPVEVDRGPAAREHQVVQPRV
ncbi:hypothetical protein GCM10010112_70840 [Actinoplanes lobatus]|uniref:Uncharacterized protein n=1 Tax=Actinoplanes lobatus TaxID=113568 RepID=A0ABQ4AF70_9ACTN|nr:hypothetical protein GCM10010112_70840 [Actinoplanes lobatus]GIE39545.1 hypothetical protein Alo02nite_24430 [Actinoplanes lobatus]